MNKIYKKIEKERERETDRAGRTFPLRNGEPDRIRWSIKTTSIDRKWGIRRHRRPENCIQIRI